MRKLDQMQRLVVGLQGLGYRGYTSNDVKTNVRRVAVTGSLIVVLMVFMAMVLMGS